MIEKTDKYFSNILLTITGLFLFGLGLLFFFKNMIIIGLIVLIFSVSMFFYRYGIAIDYRDRSIWRKRKIFIEIKKQKLIDFSDDFIKVVFLKSNYTLYGIDSKPNFTMNFDVFFETEKKKKGLIWTSTNEHQSYIVSKMISDFYNLPLEERTKNHRG
jgi:hypothetical protein